MAAWAPCALPADLLVENYFNYFTEIEEHFQRRWGAPLLLSNLDWTLMETWKDAGIPLEAVLRGIDVTFEHFQRRPSKTRKVNGLGFCVQEVLAAAEDMKEAAVGTSSVSDLQQEPRSRQGFDPETVAAFLRSSACDLQAAAQKIAGPAKGPTSDAAKTLQQLADNVEKKTSGRLEDLERHLTVLEEKIFAALLASTPDDEILKVRAEADYDLAPYRRKMSAAQIEQLQKQYIHKRLLEKYNLPRLSLFYM
jgi:hypothetical protein